jgi:hypothetical protein
MKLKIQRTRKNNSNSNSGFIIADFLFSFVLVLGIGIVIFGLTFSLATIEIAQYIVWSSARNYAAASSNEPTSATSAKLKFNNLSKQFPLLTGQGNTGSTWFSLDDFRVGNLVAPGVDPDFLAHVNSAPEQANSAGGESRQPWTGASAKITLKLFSSLRIPFLGKIAGDADKSKFTFPVRAFIIRSPSIDECQEFFKFDNRFKKGLNVIDQFGNIQSQVFQPPNEGDIHRVYGEGQEDNGC